MKTLPSQSTRRSAWLGEARATLVLAWPMVLTNLAQTAMNATDVMMLGRVGPSTLAAGALGANIFFAPMIFGLGLILATSPMIAREIGRRSNSIRDVRRTVRQGMWVAIAAILPIWLLLWQTESLLLWMAQEPELAAMAGAYMRALQWSLLPFYGFIVLRTFTSSLERPGWPMVVMFIAVAFNVFANWVLIFGNLGFPEFGIVGAGIATTASSTLMLVGMIAVVSLDRKFKRYAIFGRFWRSDWPRFREIVRLGLPVSAILVFEVSIFNAAAILMGLIDTVSLAAHAIAIQIAAISFMVPMGIGQAATVRVGRAFGAGNRVALARAGWIALAMGVGFMACVAMAMLLFPETLIMAFIDIGDPANAPVIELAVTFLALAALFQIVDGAQAVSGGMLRGLHDTTVPMIYAAIGYWGVGLTLGVILAFPFGMDGVGIWIGLSVGLAVVAVLLVARWMGRDALIDRAQASSPNTSSI